MYEETFIDRLADIFAMGGYWPYIWSAYLVTTAILIGLVVLTQREYRRQDRALIELESQLPENRRKRHGVAGNS
jgi:heme exporter protein CcmD